ncbi:MAG: DUF1849 domain-containing protein [Proteobacteria bacterium]|jgi:Domain of unknown function (DUF1849).|nr:MAG: DUF1849 domain-containing protein [Pseudomonadota bacterium]
MGNGPSRVAACLVFAVVAPEVVAAPAEQVAGLAPHRAVYDISLVEALPGAGISELTGRMVYELTGSECAGYTQKMRFVTSSTNQEGDVSITDLRTSTWENSTGDRFRFDNSQYRDQRRVEQTVGEAVRGKNPGGVRVELTKPKKRVLKIPAHVMFPVQHSRHMLELARKGETVFSVDLYDASERGEKVYSTSAYIAPRREPGFNKSLPPAENGEVLDELVSWPVALSYYEQGSEKEDALPVYEISFIFFENGVSRRLYIDYGNFSIRGELKNLTMLEPEQCKTTKKQ